MERDPDCRAEEMFSVMLLLSTGKGVRINHNHNQVSFQKEITIRSVYVHEPLSVRVWS